MGAKRWCAYKENFEIKSEQESVNKKIWPYGQGSASSSLIGISRSGWWEICPRAKLEIKSVSYLPLLPVLGFEY